ncbi:MAG TPA: hypothetical protein VJN71_05465 [Nitrososphaerales archaeon]|nr:hypothetical protein [Nitrososphaerales archaeon]
MTSSNRARLAGFLIAAVLVVFAFLAILNANLLAWPLLGVGGGAQSRTNVGPLSGELIVKAQILQPGSFQKMGGEILPFQQFSGPLSGVQVEIFSQIQQQFPLASNVTDSSGIMTLNVSQGTYTVRANTGYSNLTLPISIASGQITHLDVNVTESQSMATFYQMSDKDSVGQVLPSESVFLQFNSSMFQTNATNPHFLQTYFASATVLINSLELINGSAPPQFNSTSTANFFVQIQQVPATILSISPPSGNSSIWVELRPVLPVGTLGVEYLALATFSTAYKLTNPSVGGVASV